MREYFLEILPKISLWILVIAVVLYVIGIFSTTEPEPKKDFFTYDPHRKPWEVSSYDYSTGKVYYHQPGKPPKTKFTSSSSPEDIILDSNMEVEDIIDYQLN